MNKWQKEKRNKYILNNFILHFVLCIKPLRLYMYLNAWLYKNVVVLHLCYIFNTSDVTDFFKIINYKGFGDE